MQGVDLDDEEAAPRAEALFDELLARMADDPTVAPHRRIVFNACLTNSNAVSSELDPDADLAAEEVRDSIALEASLATTLQQRVRDKGLHTIKVLGTNGSIATVTLIDATDGLDIISVPDPKVTADKPTYVAEGQEPLGVLRAVLEWWAGVGEVGDVAQQQARVNCLAAMTERVKKAPADWSQSVIHSLYKLILAKYRDNAEMIRKLGDPASKLDELQLKYECRVENLSALAPGGDVAADAVTIFTDLCADPAFSAERDQAHRARRAPGVDAP